MTETPGDRKPMKVLLLTSSYAPVLGGLQTAAGALARNLLAMGHEVQVVTNRYPRSLPGREIVDGVSVKRWQFLWPSWQDLRRGRLDLFLASLYYGPSVRVRLRRLLASFRPDVVNIHFPDGQIPFLLGLRDRFGFRLVVSLHGHDVERFTLNTDGGLDSRELRALLREADAVTACSRYLLESAGSLEPSVNGKGAVLYNGIDPERFQDTTPYLHGRPYLFAMGRLTYTKGFDLLLEALSRPEVSAYGVDLILAGEGEDRPALEEQARRLGLEGRVHFHGRASQEEVVRLLNGCRLLVVPSRVEPFGIVALEGLAAGKRVLATRVGGMNEFLAAFAAQSRHPSEAGCVRLVEASAEALAEGLRAELASTAPEETGTGSSFLKSHSWAKVTQRYARVLAGC